MTIRTFQVGDDVAQVSIYNEAAAQLPRFKPATVDEVRRRIRGPEFDPTTRFYAIAEGRPVGYILYQPNGRISYPWCRKGHEHLQIPLLSQAMEAMRSRGMHRVFAAYRGDWPLQRDFFFAHGFQQTRELMNFYLDLVDMPTPARPHSVLSELRPADMPQVLQLGAGVLRTTNPATLEECLLRNPYFPPESLFALRSKADDHLLAVGLLITNPSYANPKELDAGMPCFRLGAFGTEQMTTKRVNGMFSFLAVQTNEFTACALDLLGHATQRLEETDIETFAAQVPSDAAHLVRFYKSVFRRQGSFPIFEREL
ncbi:MAG: hypothetical protein U0840_23605 [Gemmataceae bacterium]